jgi:hypothetical protein
VDYINHEGKIVLENGWKLDREFKHLDFGYALTSHAAQGKTVDWVFVAQSAQLSQGASDLRQFYVSTSRGRKGVKVYTDDIEMLQENVSRVRERLMATEILQAQAEETREAEKYAEMDASEAPGKSCAAELAAPTKGVETIENVREMEEPELEMELEMEM